MPSNYIACGLSYIVSVILDAFDGYAARALNQCKFIVYKFFDNFKFKMFDH